MSEGQRGQVTRNAAEIYDQFFVPALFEPWAARLTAAAALRPGSLGVLLAPRRETDRTGPGELGRLDIHQEVVNVLRSILRQNTRSRLDGTTTLSAPFFKILSRTARRGSR